MDILKEAYALYKQGLAVHWIKPNSKAPVKAGWSGPVRDDWKTVEKDYQPGYGLGTRLGESSKVEDGYLANVDVDIKSSDPKHRAEALKKLDELFPGIREKAPIVQTGYGLRLFVKTTEPTLSGKLASSSEECVVKMPTAPVNKRQRELLTEAQLAEGYRVRPAWEIEFMSTGKQVVLPPSIHPETKKPYLWANARTIAETPGVYLNGHLKRGASLNVNASKSFERFEPVAYNLEGSTLSKRIIDMVTEGTNVEDRSSSLLPVCIALLKAKFTRAQILTILTDRDTFLGETAYDHAQTEDRARAALWIEKYTLPKALAAVEPGRAFEVVEDEPAPLDDFAAAAQFNELFAEEKTIKRFKIKYTGKNGDGPPAKSVENVVAILEHKVSPEVVKRNLFASRDFYGVNTPWGGKTGASLTDEDIAHIILWLGQKYNFEPPDNTVIKAIGIIASRNAFHPVREELKALPAWDGVNRLDTWLATHFEAKGHPEYLAQVFRKWLVASVTRTFEPGAKVDWMPILQGAQGTGKSSFGSILFGQAYFTDWLPALSDKDAAFGIQGIRCAEFGELASLRKNELDITKAFITRQIDKVRPAFGRLWVELPRQCVFFGTTNMHTYLKDDSGNRRFNPVEVGKLDFKALVRDRDQLWAEALFIYENGLEESLYLDGTAHEFAKQIQSEKMVADESDFMVESLIKLVKDEALKPESEQFNFNKFKQITLFRVPMIAQRWPESGRSIHFLSKALRNLKFYVFRSNGKNYWKIDKKDIEHILEGDV